MRHDKSKPKTMLVTLTKQVRPNPYRITIADFCDETVRNIAHMEAQLNKPRTR